MLLVITLPFMGQGIARAQVIDTAFTPEQTAQISALIEQITNLKIQLILAQIAEIQAQILVLQSNVSVQNTPTPSTNSGQTGTTGGASTGTPTPVIAPTPSATIGTQSCQGTQAIVPVVLANVQPTDVILRAHNALGQANVEWYNNGNALSGFMGYDSNNPIESGTYSYTLSVYTGYMTRFGQSGTADDHRTLVVENSGQLIVSSCQ